MAFLDDKLYEIPTSPGECLRFIARIWSARDMAGSEPKNLGLDVSASCTYYLKQCNEATPEEDHVSARSRRDITDIVDQILRGDSKEDILLRLRSTLSDIGPHQEMEHQVRVNNSVDLAARLVSMMDIGRASCYHISGSSSLAWDRGSLKGLIHTHFAQRIRLGHDVKLEGAFDGRNLERIAGIRIDWTSNLVEHLRVFDHGEKSPKSVAIFHYASFLKYQQR